MNESLWPPPLLSERTQAQQIGLVLVVPAIFGAITGYALGHSEGVYLVLLVIAAIGGFLAGFEHADAGSGAKRGLLAGAVFGAFILIAHEIEGSAAAAKLPDPAILLVIVDAIAGALLTALGAWIRGRRSSVAAL